MYLPPIPRHGKKFHAQEWKNLIHTQEKNYSNRNRYTNDLGITSRRQELQNNYDKYVKKKKTRGKDGLNEKRDEEFQ